MSYNSNGTSDAPEPKEEEAKAFLSRPRVCFERFQE